jgi:hypothetical protein
MSMFIVQIEHPVPNFDGWKAAFDSDPVGRERAGVRRYRVMRPADNANYAIVDLEFDTLAEAEAMQVALRELWGRVQGTVIHDPRLRIVEIVEFNEF